jgi:RNA polymerase sigma-70 factor (ECF subfamily)
MHLGGNVDQVSSFETRMTPDANDGWDSSDIRRWIKPAPTDPQSSQPAKGKAFLRLFLENERRLYAYILTLLANRADADDVLQDVSMVMWDKFDDQRPPDDFAAWGCRIAYFKILDFFKKRQRSRVQFSQTMLERVAETAIEQADCLRLDERREALADCLEKLNPMDRELLALRFSPGATTQSTAAQVGRSVDAIYKTLAKIRLALFDCVNNALA